MVTQSKRSVSAAVVAAASNSAASASSASSPSPFVHAIGGSIGGALATLAFYPLELIRVEMQSQGNKGSSNSSKNPQENDGECKNPTSTSNHHTASSSSEPETNLECFIRLYKKQALYRGASNMVTTMIISSFITFYALEVTRRSLSKLRQHNGHHQQHHQQQHGKQIRRLHNHMRFLNFILPKSNVGTSLLASSLAGVINVFLTTPLWVATRRIMESQVVVHSPPLSQPDTDKQPKTQKRQPNLWKVMHQISCNEGVLQLWHGTWSSLLLVSNPAIQFFLYEQVRVWLLERKRKGQGRRTDRRHHHRGGGDGSSKILSLTPMEAFVFGAMAKTVSTVITYPLQLAQVLIRLRNNEVQNASSSSLSSNSNNSEHKIDDQNMKAYKGITDCLYQQFTRGGFYSLFQGMNSKMLQTVLSAAFTFLTYEQTLVLVGRVYQSSLAAR